MDASRLGQWIAIVFLGVLAFWFLFKALSSSVRSARLANLSLFFGLLVFCRPEMNMDLVNNPFWYGIIAVARTILGGVGVVCGIVALRCRVKDQGVTLTRTILGGLFSLFHMVAGVSLLILPGLLSGFISDSPTPSSWVYRSSQHDFSLTLPNSDWVQLKYPGGAVGFKNRRYPMQVGIDVRAATEEFFQARVEALRRNSTSGLQNRKHEEGKTKTGYVFDLISGVEQAKDGSNEIYVTLCIFWHPERGQLILLTFEGSFQMRGQSGKQFELALFEDSARSICLSLE